MTRKYSDELVSFLDDGDISKAGILLAKLCIQANLPAKYVAIALNVSRMTIYSWFRGSYLREKNQDSVRDLIDILKNDLNEGVLPVSDIDGAKLYLEEISGKTMLIPVLEKLGKKVELQQLVEILPLTKDEQYKLAGLCLSQDDKKQAFIWYQKSAEAGHIEAQYHLGCIFCLEESKIEDYFIPPEEDDYLDFIDNAIFWYEKAALAGHIEAQYQLGNLHCEYGYSDKADFWYQKAAEQGHVEALAELYEHIEREYDSRVDDIEQEVSWKKEVAELGYIKAQYDLGKIYRDGYREIEPDSDEAEYWFREVANNTSNKEDNSYFSQAEYELGDIYLKSYSKLLSITDFDVAVFWYSEALKKGNGNAHKGLGDLYYERYKTTSSEDDFEQTICSYTEAQAHNRLGDIYYERYKANSSDGDFNQTIHWYTEAQARNRLGDIYYERYKANSSDGDLNHAIFWCKKAVKEGNELAEYQLGEIYSIKYDESLLEEDFTNALHWFEKVANRDKVTYLSMNAHKKLRNLILDKPKIYGIAHKGLGDLYYERYKTTSSEDDFEQTICSYTEAQAHNRLGDIYYERYKANSSDGDLNHAIFWCKKAAKEGNELAEYQLGEIYSIKYDESLLEEDFTNALHWFEKVANRDKVTYLSMNAHKKLRNLILDKPKIFRIPE